MCALSRSLHAKKKMKKKLTWKKITLITFSSYFWINFFFCVPPLLSLAYRIIYWVAYARRMPYSYYNIQSERCKHEKKKMRTSKKYGVSHSPQNVRYSPVFCTAFFFEYMVEGLCLSYVYLHTIRQTCERDYPSYKLYLAG